MRTDVRKREAGEEMIDDFIVEMRKLVADWLGAVSDVDDPLECRSERPMSSVAAAAAAVAAAAGAVVDKMAEVTVWADSPMSSVLRAVANVVSSAERMRRMSVLFCLISWLMWRTTRSLSKRSSGVGAVDGFGRKIDFIRSASLRQWLEQSL